MLFKFILLGGFMQSYILIRRYVLPLVLISISGCSAISSVHGSGGTTSGSGLLSFDSSGKAPVAQVTDSISLTNYAVSQGYYNGSDCGTGITGEESLFFATGAAGHFEVASASGSSTTRWEDGTNSAEEIGGGIKIDASSAYFTMDPSDNAVGSNSAIASNQFFHMPGSGVGAGAQLASGSKVATRLEMRYFYRLLCDQGFQNSVGRAPLSANIYQRVTATVSTLSAKFPGTTTLDGKQLTYPDTLTVSLEMPTNSGQFAKLDVFMKKDYGPIGFNYARWDVPSVDNGVYDPSTDQVGEGSAIQMLVQLQ